ncbi:GerW family sporulation protein [Methanobrevibacter woesei]|uniref:GerW family sporulation protein n=1 Tax=Methanobrevibacter woesei TaxID=190976 RepID=UPI0023F57FD7|nr:spore germination protein GerW family protein [Methanobrevibacter woesei]MCI7290979.1 sporulation protein [Methanobrevibacter woesei]
MVESNIRATVEELRKLTNVNNYIGEPIETDDKILIPVMRMGVGFAVGKNMIRSEDSDIVGAGAGVEPTSMVIIPKSGDTTEGMRVLNLTKGNEVNKALSDLGLVISDLVKEYIKKDEDDDYDEGEYIEPNTPKVTD